MKRDTRETKTFMKRDNMEHDKTGKDIFEKGQIWKGQI